MVLHFWCVVLQYKHKEQNNKIMEKVKTTQIMMVDLKKLRKKAGLSLRELEKVSGVSFAHINKIENGLTMTEDTWNKIKKALDKKIKQKSNEQESSVKES